MNRKVFFDSIRKTLFGQLSQPQVDGLSIILTEWLSRGLTDLRWLAYILATVYHETGATMQPVPEGGKGRGRKYGNPDPQTGKVYYGRGYVQLTWKRNYQLFADRYEIDLVNHPEKAMQPDIAVRILFDGMIEGLYTGVGLRECFGKTTDWESARAIVNSTDCAEKIAVYAQHFYYAVKTAAEFVETETPKISEVTTTGGETLTMIEHETPQPAPAYVAESAPELPTGGGGWLTHAGMAVTGLIGLAAMLGYVPGMTPEYGAGMIQTALGISGTRKAAPTLIKFALQTYMTLRSKTA